MLRGIYAEFWIYRRIKRHLFAFKLALQIASAFRDAQNL